MAIFVGVKLPKKASIHEFNLKHCKIAFEITIYANS